MRTHPIAPLALALVVVAAGLLVGVAPAAAAPADGSRNAPSSVAPGGTASVTVTVTMDASGGSLTLNETFSGDVASASIGSVSVDGSSVQPVISAADANGAVVTLSSTGANASVEVTYDVTAASGSGSITIEGKATGDNVDVDLGTSTISVQQDPMTASASLDDKTVKPGKTTTVRTTVENPRSSLTVNQSFPSAVSSASVSAVTVNGASASPTVSTADATGSVVTLSGLNLSDTVEVAVKLTVDSNATVGATHDLTGTASSGSSQVSLGTQTIEVIDPDPVKRYDGDKDDTIEITELGSAATDYALGDLSIAELAQVASKFAS